MSVTSPRSLSPCAVSRLRLAGCLVLMLAVGAVGGAVTSPAIPAWYQGLVKPGWTPPNAAFPIVWTLLYLMMAVSLWRLWDKVPPSSARTVAIGLFLVQLALNFIWSPVFFGLHAIHAGLVIIIGLVVLLALTLRATFPLDRTAGWLLVPYLVWVCYASTLNAGIAVLN
ncbi:TspO/MBR family protein [Xanthobacter aminoxidans]|uniref:TspO/MBR family protein n=1 Tax=Xanthobacter aminoxidans TaxID=186280 RepID=A0ABW6ZMP3_9HYPH